MSCTAAAPQVEIDINNQAEEPEYEEDEETGEVEETIGASFSVFVNKGGDENLVFSCVSDGTYLEVQHVALEPVSDEVEASLYTGPVR